MKRTKRQLLMLLGALALTTALHAHRPLVPADTLRTDSVAPAPADTTAAKKEAPKKEETEYEKIVKKAVVTDGLFRVVHNGEKYYFEVPDSLLGRLFLCVTRFTAVPQGLGQFAGEEITHCTVYFEQRDTTQLLLRQYVQSHISDEGDHIARTVEKATIDPIVRVFANAGRNPQGDAQLIEVTGLFKGDGHLISMSGPMKNQLKVGGLQSDRTFIDTLKVYPQNIEVATTRTYSASGTNTPAGRTGSLTMAFNTSIVALPWQPMRRRIWDERVGYFVNSFVRFTDQQHKTEHESFVSRYRLVPRNKKKYLRGELTEPEKPIVYYIDPATPPQWVPYLIKGVEDWNVAFEAAGFKNAIQAREWPKDDPTMSLDDARYSVIRYLPSETENAYGPRIVDPRSGEIIEAHICWFHNVMSLLTKWYMVQCGPLDKRARTMQFDDKLMGQLVRFVSSHEVGHTLGLRHNMGSSAATPVEKLRDKHWVEAHGHTASIMDYARFNYVAQPEDNISEAGLFPRIGDYDKWAIRWGYQWRPEFKDEYEEKERLMTETTAMLRGNQRLWFGGEGMGEDPRAQTEDLGDDNVKASEYGILNLKRVMQGLPEWTRQPNDQYDDLKDIYATVRGQFTRYVNHCMKNMGAHYHNNLPGEEPLSPVPAWRQREVVRFMGEQVFDAPQWLYPAHIISKTGTDATADNNSRQELQLGRLLNVNLLCSLYDASTTDADAYQLPDYLNDLFSQVWKPIGDASEWKNSARRQLQRAYLQNIDQLLNPNDAARATGGRSYRSDALLYVQQHLQQVEHHCQAELEREPQGINALHYQDLLRRIQLIRERLTKK